MRLLALALTSLMATSLLAGVSENHPLYIRAQAGMMRQHVADDSLRDTAGAIVAKLSKDEEVNLAGRLAVGVNVTNNFAVELGHLRMSDQKYKIKNLASGAKIDSIDAHANATDLAAKASLPLAPQVNLFLLSGLAYYNIDNDSDGNATANFDYSEAAIRPELGAGVSLRLTGSLMADASYTHIFGKGSAEADNSNFMPDLQFYSLGITYLF